jgi:glycosyltransferase involved in cell wall biosynthesis
LNVLHLTHTDIRVDSRILKELSALESAGCYQLHAIGVAEHGATAGVNELHGTTVVSIRLWSRSARWLPAPIRHSLALIEMLIRFLLAAWPIKPSLIHCHDTPLLPIGVMLAWIFDGKVIYDAHELESDKNGQSGLMSSATLWVEKSCWGGVDGFVTVSNSILRWYDKHLSVKKSTLVLNSPFIPTLHNSEEAKRYFHELYKIPKESLVFVYLGLFVPGRGIEKLLQVFSDARLTAHVVFVGRGPQRALVEQFARANLRVHVHDAVPHNQVVELVKSADYGLCLVENVSLSDYYSLPNKLFEYAFAGIPVLASDFPDMQQLIAQYRLGAVAENEVKSITQAVLRLQSSGKQRVDADLTELGWDAQAEKLRSLYQTVLTPMTSQQAAQ